ncbi:hypothetical protein HYH02_006468 [Chlamydomonas schloesseri]|uniref:Proline dehydrogenase n=1 Tax=Chlamydomonas schloesseri TaxID=2026947 RepID=A0A835WJK6_9CHLO|nr:hypothetical protein HYH02_006468 [Chlamydomonas schloesseri]|eukprot:KAG2448577.1 hypothetical protein HYH02_006468 [Chlamydomonas schloesseri]
MAAPMRALSTGVPARVARSGLHARGPAPLNTFFRSYGWGAERTKEKGATLQFEDHQAIFEGRTTSDLFKSLLVLRLCSTPSFVASAEGLLANARRVLGDSTALSFVQSTFYQHFVAGKDAGDVWGRMNTLRANGVGAILDYAEEEDLLTACKQPAPPAAANAAAAAAAGAQVSARDPLGGESLIKSRVAARTYTFQDDATCERHTQAFIAAIDTAATLPGQGFAAIKLTALGDPALLEHLAAALDAVKALFRRYDSNNDGFVTREGFLKAFERIEQAQGRSSSEAERNDMWAWLDPAGDGRIDYVTWASRLDLRRLPDMAGNLKQELQSQSQAGAGGRQWELSAEELRQLEALFGRLERLVAQALKRGVKLMIDAEQSHLRPAIDHVARELMREHNKPAAAGGDGAVIFISYQAYLRDVQLRLQRDLERAERQGYVLGAKLVRGAYLHLERRRAAQAGAPSPVWDHMGETTATFDGCTDALLAAVKAGRAELMVGTHNRSSVEGVIERMERLGLEPEEAPVYFGQLLGMADNISFTLGQHGYKVFKYCPYGQVDKVIPYLMRRVNEAQYTRKGGKEDAALLLEELMRRVRDPQHSPLARIFGTAS